MENKRMTIANLNVTFGTHEEPMLDHFLDIIMPALLSVGTWQKSNSEYSIKNVKVNKVSSGEFVLTGIIVRSTILEVLSKIDSADNLIQTQEHHPSAPYSLFVVFLKNHRMALIQNQKGSPTIRNFATMLRYKLNTYINVTNRYYKNDKLPHSFVNVIGIPIREDIIESLKKVSVIQKMILRFYPLNGDINYGDLFSDLTNDLRKDVGSKTGSIILNSPKSIKGIAEVLTEAKGTIEPTFEVKYKDGTEGKIRNDELSENLYFPLVSSANLARSALYVANEIKDMQSLKVTSEEHESIYARNLKSINEIIK